MGVQSESTTYRPRATLTKLCANHDSLKGISVMRAPNTKRAAGSECGKADLSDFSKLPLGGTQRGLHPRSLSAPGSECTRVPGSCHVIGRKSRRLLIFPRQVLKLFPVR